MTNNDASWMDEDEDEDEDSSPTYEEPSGIINGLFLARFAVLKKSGKWGLDEIDRHRLHKG